MTTSENRPYKKEEHFALDIVTTDILSSLMRVFVVSVVSDTSPTTYNGH